MSTTQRDTCLRKCPKIVLLVGGSFELRNSFPALEQMVEGLEVQGTAQVKSLEDLIKRITECLQELPSCSRAVGVVVAEPLNGCFNGMSAELLARELGNKLEGEAKKATTIVVVGNSANSKTILRKLQLQGD